MNVPEPSPIESPPPAAPLRRRVNWLLVFPLLLAPAVLSLLAASAKSDGLAIGAALLGGGLAGIICGVHIARCVGKTSGARVLLGFVFCGVLGFLSFCLGFAGCMMGGFKMDFK